MRDNFKTFLVLIATLFLFQTVWGQVNYGITVAGTEVTSENASNVLNDDYSSVSYDAGSNTLTLKGVHLNSANNGISVPSDLNINLVGYSDVGTINVTSGTLNFTTSTTLPGCLKTNIAGNSTITYGAGTGLSWDGTMVKSSNTNPYIIYATGYKGNGDEYWKDNGDIMGYSTEGDVASLDVSTDVTVVYSLNNASIDYFKVSSNSDDPKSCYIYPGSLDDMNLVNKVYFLFDWGTCTNKNVKVQVRGMNSNYGNDGTYSEEVSLPSNGGLVEIPLTGTVNSYYFQIYFSSTTGEFSFIPISVGFQKTENYGLTVGGVEVTSSNASNITGANIQGTVSYDVESHTLTLNGASIIPDHEMAGISYKGETDLTIILKGTNTVKGIGGCSAITYSGQLDTPPSLTFTKDDTQACSVQFEAQGESAIDAFAEGNISYDGLYRLDDEIVGVDVPSIYTTTFTSTLLSGGSGTTADPFIIGAADDLKNLAKYVNDGILSTEYIKLGGDIDCTNLTGFEPIGNNTKSFIGTFDGDGKSITGLTFSNTNPDGVSGLFGNIGKYDSSNDEITRGTVMNLTLSGCQFGNGAQNGAIAGYLHYGTIENCTVTSCTISSGNSQSTYSGGITGMVYNGIVKDCTVNGGTITSSITNSGDGYVYAGGIVAYAYSYSNINGCTVTDVSINSTGNGQNSYSGGIVGYSEATISGNSVKGSTTVNSSNNDNIETLVGAIVANRADGSFTNNYYYYTVKTKTTIGSNDPEEKSGYTQRGIGGTYYNETTEQNEPNPDVTTDNGAVMYTKKVTFPTVTGATITKDGNYYSYDATGINIAPGQTATMIVEPSAGYIISSFTATSVEDAAISSTALTENRTRYSFVMPDAAVTVNVTCNQVYNLWIGETQVTSANAANVLGDGKVSFTESVGVDTTPTYTLTLNGATLTVPVIVGLPNLTIDIPGTNSITTEERCIQKMENTTPAVTFTSTSTEVGSLTLKSEAGVNDIGVDHKGSFSISDKLALVLKKSGLIYSNQYWFTDGTTTEAKLSPSYGVTVGEMQICPDNADDVIGYGIGDGNQGGMVSFDKESSTLTLTNASLSGIIRSSLPNLTVELVGNNSIYSGGDRVIQAGVAVNMTIQSSATVKGSLSMQKGYSSTSLGNFVDDNVNLTISEPLAVVSGSLTDDNAANDYYATIGVSYGLTVAGVTVSNANASAITGTYIQKKTDDGSVSYDAESKTLTLNNVNLSTTASAPIIVSGLDALKVNIVGEVEFEFQGVNPSYVFNSTNTNGVLTFTTTDDGDPQIYIDNGSNAGAFTGFKTVNYENGLALRTNQVDLTDYWIEPMAAPMVDDFSLDEGTGKLTGYIIPKYNYEGATIKYSIDYADDHEDVSNAVYGTSVVMEGPGTLTAYIAVGESTSPVTTAKWFAFTSHEVQGVIGQTSVAVPAVIPTIATSDNITVTYSSNATTIASVSEGNITFNGVGATTIRGLFETGTVPFIILNDGDIFDEIAVTVVPPAPVIAYDDTKTYLSTDKIEISLDAAYAAAPSGSNTIYYSWAENPTTGTVYPEGGVAAEAGTHTLTAWVVATVSDVNYESAKVTQAFTVLVNPELTYKQGETSVTTATWTIDGTNNTALPVLQNTHNVAVTYESNNTAVATVANDGTVTVVGIGTATITATAAATDVSAADEAYYTLTVNRQMNVSFDATNEWATYYGTENLATPAGLKAYQVTEVNGSTVTTAEIGYIPANTAVLLQNVEGKTAAANTIASAYTGATSTFPNNLLIGSTEAVGVSSINGGTVYVLYNDMFKRATSGTIPANRAYLIVSGAAPARLNIVHGGDDTGIDNIHMDETNDNWYTIDGRKLNGQPQRAGFYIRNGKKVYKR